MRLIDLLMAIGADVESNEEIQICHPGRGWDDYDEFNAGSKLLKPFYEFEIKALSNASLSHISPSQQSLK